MNDFYLDKKEYKATWIYEYDMWKNPTIFLTIWGIFVLCSLVPSFVVFISIISDGFLKAFIFFGKVFGIVFGIISILLFLTYVLVCIINGGKYIVIFELDNLGIKHIQMDKQFTKVQGITYIGTLIGALKKDLITIGSNMIASQKHSIYSEFKKVRIIENNKKRNTIKLRTSNGFNNQIYVDDKHYEDILKMIKDKCPKSVVLKNRNGGVKYEKKDV